MYKMSWKSLLLVSSTTWLTVGSQYHTVGV